MDLYLWKTSPRKAGMEVGETSLTGSRREVQARTLFVITVLTRCSSFQPV